MGLAPTWAPFAPGEAIAAPEALRHFGTPTRRAWIGGVLATAWAAAGGRAAATLDAEGGSPVRLLRGRPGEPLRLTSDARAPVSLLGLRVEGGPGFPGLAGALASDERREIVVVPREPGFGLYGSYSGGTLSAVVIEEAPPPAVDLDAVVLFSGAAGALRANGAALPATLAAPPAARVRLRLANAAPDLALTLYTPAPTRIVAIDGQPCEMFAPAGGAFPLCPSARFELMLDLGDAPVEFFARGFEGPALRIVAAGTAAPARARIRALPANPRLPRAIALEKALRVEVAMTGAEPYRIGGVGGGPWPAKPLFRVRRGTPVVLRLTNDTPLPQTMRLEGHVARLLHALDDGWDPYWRDALAVAPGRKLLAAFVADNPGAWPLASASPERRAAGLAAWFVVT